MIKMKVNLIIFLIGFLCLTTSNFFVIPASGDTIIWHSSIQEGTILGWRFVELNYQGDNPFSIGEENISVNDVMQITFNDKIPTNLDEVYRTDHPTFLNTFLNGKRLSREEEPDDILFATVTPIICQLNNGTILNSVDFLLMMPEVVNASLQGSYIVTFMELGGGVQKMILKNHKDSGISYELFLEFPGLGSLRWEFYPDASNVDITGIPKPITAATPATSTSVNTTTITSLNTTVDTDELTNSTTHSAPGFAVISLVTGLGILILVSNIIRKSESFQRKVK
ncbi:MAG: hypothetical protein ACFFCQ_14860 [Promethearchaeota archaeon]